MRIYIAHVYGRQFGLSEEELEQNAQDSIEWGRKVLMKGHLPFVPNLYHYFHKGWDLSPKEQIYFDLVSHWLRFCDALFVAKLPPVEWHSSGVLKEVNIAQQLKLPVYFKFEDIPNEG